jgi:hypothetical protein
MKLIKIPQILSYTKVKRKYIHLKSRPDVIIPKGGLSYEERLRREQVIRDKSEQDYIHFLMRDRPTKKDRIKVAKPKRVLHQIEIGCVRAGFTFYKTLSWYE